MRQIGIFSSPEDDHGELVEAELERRGLPYHRFDRPDFSSDHLAAAISNDNPWEISYSGQKDLRLDQFRSIWYRRPSKFRFPDGMTREHRAFAEGEARSGFGGLLRSLPCLWVNNPDANAAAEWKPRQLEVARRVGLTIPRTIITNDVTEALSFVEELEGCGGKVIYKTLLQPSLSSPSGPQIIYTSLVTAEQVKNNAEAIAATANLFQEFIPKKFDVRMTCFGKQVFATAIHSGSKDAWVDFRADYGALRYEAHQLPSEVEQACLRLMDAFQLQFAAIDLVANQDGYTFLEINPNGQWGWLEEATGQPMVEALVDLLDSVE